MQLISTSIDIEAPAERVWQILTDVEEYPDWNHFIGFILGQLTVGERLTVRINPPGGKGMTFKPVVLTARAND